MILLLESLYKNSPILVYKSYSLYHDILYEHIVLISGNKI